MVMPFVCVGTKPARCVLSLWSWESILHIQVRLMNANPLIYMRGEARYWNVRAFASRWCLRSWGGVCSLRKRIQVEEISQDRAQGCRNLVSSVLEVSPGIAAAS